MNEKDCRRTALTAAIVSTLAIGAAALPYNTAFAKSALGLQPPKSNAIIGTGADAIIGTGADAIIGTGADAIVGTGRSKPKSNAIIGTGADAIIGTGADAIIGTGRQSNGAFVAVMGAVEKVDQSTGSLSILGRQLRIPATSGLMNYVNEAMAAGNVVALAVVARVDATGKLSGATARVVPGQYVPGTSIVFLTDRVTLVNSSTGSAVVGATAVDYTNLLATKRVSLSVGDIVTITGTQPQAGQVILASGLVPRGK